MSAGAFADGKYEDDLGNIYACRIQPETVGLQLNGAINTIPAGDTDMPVSARMTGSRRAIGCRARSVRIRFTAAPPTGYLPGSIIEIPIFQQSIYNTMTAVQKATGTYLGVAIVCVGGTGEERN